MFYQIKVDSGVWRSMSELGCSNLRRVRQIAAPDTFTFTLESATALTADDVFPYGADIRVRRQPTDSTAATTVEWFFRGRVTSNPRQGSGAYEARQVVVSGPWDWFQNTTFLQAWNEMNGGSIQPTQKPRCVLYGTAYDARITTGKQIQLIIQAAVNGGAPCTVPTITAGITPPLDEQININCAQALTRCLTYHPHASIWFDYSTETPACRFGQRTAATPKNVAFAAVMESLEISTRNDLKVNGICIYYEKANSVDGRIYPVTTIDKAPANVDPAKDGVLNAVYDLKGDTIQTLSTIVTAEAFQFGWENNLAWWTARVPWLADYSTVTLSGGKRRYRSNLSNLLISGSELEGSGLSIADEEVEVTAKLIQKDASGNVIESVQKHIVLNVKVTGSPPGMNRYAVPIGGEAGETVPTGIAASLYSEWSQLHHEGRFTITDKEPPAFSLGNSLNITGGRTEWATMKAMISCVEEDIDRGSTFVAFGPSGNLGIDARVMFERAARNRESANSLRGVSGVYTAAGTVIPPVEADVRDGAVASALHRLVLTSDGAVAHKIDLNTAGIDPSTKANSADGNEATSTAAMTFQPRAVYLPVYYLNGTNWVPGLQKFMVLASEPIGSIRHRVSTLTA